MDVHWTRLDEEALRDEARLHRGACDDGDLDPADLRWTLLEMPIARLAPVAPSCGWAAWIADEIADQVVDHDEVRGASWPSPTDPTDEVREPVVVTIDGDRVQLWDGWHRTASAAARGDATIPCILGTMPGEDPAAVAAVGNGGPPSDS